MFTDFVAVFLQRRIKKAILPICGKTLGSLFCCVLMASSLVSCTENRAADLPNDSAGNAQLQQGTETSATHVVEVTLAATSETEDKEGTKDARESGDNAGSETGAGSDRTSPEPEIIATSSAEPSPAVITKDTISKEQLESIIRFRPNELGELLIVLYHHIGGEDSLYYRSVASFKKDLQNLYEKGYRLISIEDYINSNYDIPAGTTPVVLTFDDGPLSHFEVAFDAEGNPYPHPDCAVGILDAFYKEHPDFGRHAVFYINGGAFHQPAHLEWKLKYLYENGYEIGNHTLNHAALDSLDGEGIQRELGKNENFYRHLVPDLRMISVAYPFGNRPRAEHRHLVLNGEYEGEKYEYQIGIIAGWCPTKPLYSRKMHPLEVYRVQGGVNAQQLDWWLALLDREPQRRFVSDGIPGMIFVPESLEEELDMELVGEDRVFFYEESE